MLKMNADATLTRYTVFYVGLLLLSGIGAVTMSGLGWYTGLRVPAGSPSQTLVAVIWLALFLTTTQSVARFWNRELTSARSRLTELIYMANAGLVILWNYLFFGLRDLRLAFAAATFVAISVLVLIVRLWRADRTSAALLLPFLLWMAFALAFSYKLILLN